MDSSGKKLPWKGRKMWICCMGWGQKLEVPILKLSPSSCLLLLSWSPGAVQHPWVSPVSLWNNNMLSGLLYPYLCRKSLCRELLLAGKASVHFSRWDHCELPLGCAGIPGCLFFFWRRAKNCSLSIVFVQIGRIIILLCILMKREEVFKGSCPVFFRWNTQLKILVLELFLSMRNSESSEYSEYF